MAGNNIEADYLVVGGGAMGMAFTDVLVAESDASVVIVDRHHRPGGHWNDAYPFVRLHQPSAFYGVNSEPLGKDAIDASGWNQGLYELASGAEVCAYFDYVMQQKFLPSGRVQYFPMCEYQEGGDFASRLTGDAYHVSARERVVDATYMNVTVPSMRPPEYEVAPGVRCVPLNDLPSIMAPPSKYVIVGAGKTGMDAALWLLAQNVDPDAIRWIMPRDSWILDRASIQPAREAGTGIANLFAKQMETVAGVESIDELFDALHASGQLLRLDDDVKPTMYRCATVTLAELEQLQRIKDVVRLGRVQRLEPQQIVLEKGSMPADPDMLFVDCSADGLERRPVLPVFDGSDITLQTVRTCQQVFSAALIARVEIGDYDDAKRNQLCGVVPHPNSDIDWLRTTLANNANQAQWAQDEALQHWLNGARLDGFRALTRSLAGAGPEEVQQVQAQAFTAMMKLQQLLSDFEGASAEH